LIGVLQRAAEKRFITETDLLKFTWIADPQIAPDGSSVAFVRVTVNEKENRYQTSLFTVATTGGESPRRLTSNVRFPRESHELSRSGEPKHRVERLQHIAGWMDQWLQGKRNGTYSTTSR
jgi:dipeptidyl aminopeptidase/acylaminoacyl peptidase